METIGNKELYLPLQFTVYYQLSVKSPHGVIKYNLRVATKDGRYRVIATDFVFHYLKRNRYGKFVEVKGKSKPLEDPFFKGQQKLWERHKLLVAEKINTLAATIKDAMLMPPTASEKEIVKVDSDW